MASNKYGFSRGFTWPLTGDEAIGKSKKFSSVLIQLNRAGIPWDVAKKITDIADYHFEASHGKNAGVGINLPYPCAELAKGIKYPQGFTGFEIRIRKDVDGRLPDDDYYSCLITPLFHRFWREESEERSKREKETESEFQIFLRQYKDL